jgi:hypothetical protein
MWARPARLIRLAANPDRQLQLQMTLRMRLMSLSLWIMVWRLLSHGLFFTILVEFTRTCSILLTQGLPVMCLIEILRTVSRIGLQVPMTGNLPSSMMNDERYHDHEAICFSSGGCITVMALWRYIRLHPSFFCGSRAPSPVTYDRRTTIARCLTRSSLPSWPFS